MFGVRSEGDFGGAACAADVEAVNGDGVVFFLGGFFARVEFAALVDVFAAAVEFGQLDMSRDIRWTGG